MNVVQKRKFPLVFFTLMTAIPLVAVITGAFQQIQLKGSMDFLDILRAIGIVSLPLFGFLYPIAKTTLSYDDDVILVNNGYSKRIIQRKTLIGIYEKFITENQGICIALWLVAKTDKDTAQKTQIAIKLFEPHDLRNFITSVETELDKKFPGRNKQKTHIRTGIIEDVL